MRPTVPWQRTQVSFSAAEPVDAAGREFEQPAAATARRRAIARNAVRVDGMNVLQGSP
jgi:hypothetical protein